eukprot:scaffold1774_cov121-Isochrysis_galbana.AAC.14
MSSCHQTRIQKDSLPCHETACPSAPPPATVQPTAALMAATTAGSQLPDGCELRAASAHVHTRHASSTYIRPDGLPTRVWSRIEGHRVPGARIL